MDSIVFEETACVLCGCDRNSVWLTSLKDRWFDRPETFTLVRCQNCGHIFQNPRPTLATLGACYPAQYQPYHSIKSKLSAFLKRIVLKREAADCVAQKPPPGSVLELGCAEGLFLQVLRARGYHAEGVEFDSGVAARAKQAELKVFSGTLVEAQLPPVSFDLVYSKHVIEHLPDVRETLREIRRILKPEGVLLVATPNIECPLVRFFKADSLDLDLPRHLNLWSCEGLRKQIESAGFEVLRISHDPVPNSWVRSLYLRLEQHPWARRFFVLENPFALLLFAPLSLALALAGKSSRIRLWAKKKAE